MRKLKKVTVVMICISIFYIVLSSVLPSASLSFRTWADVLGQGILLLLTPLLMVVIFVAWIQRRERMHAVFKSIISMAAAVGYLLWAYLAGLFILFGVHEERMIAPNLLVQDESEFMYLAGYSYYRPVAFLFKTPAELTDEVKIHYLEEKYGRKFMTDMSGSGFLYDEEMPDVNVSVYLSNMQLEDDYAEQILYRDFDEDVPDGEQ